MSRLLTVREVALILHPKSDDPSTVYRLIRSGALPAYRPTGRDLMVYEDDLEAFIASRRVQPARPRGNPVPSPAATPQGKPVHLARKKRKAVASG